MLALLIGYLSTASPAPVHFDLNAQATKAKKTSPERLLNWRFLGLVASGARTEDGHNRVLAGFE